MAIRWIGKSLDGKTVTLKKLEGCPITPPSYASPSWAKEHHDQVRIGLVLDLETTGLNQQEDEIIEIGIRQFLFNRSTGEVIAVGVHYESFQQPLKPITAEITAITGINNEMVDGKNIDWNIVTKLIEESSIIIAHNARFDRPFIDKKSIVSREKIWACSLKQIDWTGKGFSSAKLEFLSIYHGFFTDSHRAMFDVDALLYLLSLPQPENQIPYLNELLTNARRPMVQVIASSAPFESKEHLKSRLYSWDNTNRFWTKFIFKDELATETTWLEESVYAGPFAGIVREINLADNFKN